MMIKETFLSISAFLRGGTSHFNNAELMLTTSVLDKLPESDRNILSTQIASISLIQRHHSGRLVVAYYSKNKAVPVLPYSGHEYCLAKVSYKSDYKIKTTNLVLHDGKFMSLERNVPINNKDINSITKVILHPNNYKPIAKEIDVGEHGKNV
jgi:hypothetical protein